MGRLLDIARAVPVVDTGPEERTIKQVGQLDRTAYRTACRTEGGAACAVSERSAVSQPPGLSQSASDVLDVLVKAGAPMLHTAIVAALATRGYTKAAAYRAIADCQGRGWIEHGLTTGYVLSGEAEGAAE